MKLSPSSQMMFNVLHITMLNNDHKEIGTATGFLFGFCKKDDGRIFFAWFRTDMFLEHVPISEFP